MLTKLTYLDTDLGRDLFEISNLFLHKIVWLGPRLSLGFHVSPIYYYQYLPLFYLSQGNPASLWWTQAILSILVLHQFYLHTRSTLTLMVLATSTLWLTLSLHPGNGYIYALWLALAVINRWEFALGISIACHPLGITGLPFFLPANKRKFIKLLFFVLLPWTPILVFETITKGFLLRSIFSSGLHFSSTIFPHYFFGIKIILLITVLKLLQKFKYKQSILNFWLFINLLFLPKYFATLPLRTINTVGDTARYIMAQNIIDRHRSLNIISVLGSANKVPAGDDYRFFFQMSGYQLKDTFSYASSDQLLIINEVPDLNWQSLNGWEISQFKSQPYTETKTLDINNNSITVLKRSI